ncbi:MAG: hypothetical protein AB8I08_22730 [Sandaracinaceae bacterium]
MRRLHALLVLLALTIPAACAAPGDDGSGAVPPLAGKADGIEHPLDALGEDATLSLAALPTSVPDADPMRDPDTRDLGAVADLYDTTFETGGTARSAFDALSPSDDDVLRAIMFASAHESEVRDDEAELNGVAWTADELRALYALAWLDAPESLRQTIGDGETPLNPALFHVAFTQLLAQGHTVVRGGADTAGAVFTGFEIKGMPREEEASGPREISREGAESYVRGPVVDAAAYHYLFASIRTTRGFSSESYILATDADGEIVAGYWTAPNDAFPPLHPTRIWFAPERPEAGPVDFDQVDSIAAAFGQDVPGAIGDTYLYTGEPVAFTENRFYCARVAMQIGDRFRVGDITVRATMSYEGFWTPDLEIKLYHAPTGNGQSLVELDTRFDDEEGEWTTSEFNFEGSESANSPWELRVCDTSSRGDQDDISGFVNSFEIEFHSLD